MREVRYYKLTTQVKKMSEKIEKAKTSTTQEQEVLQQRINESTEALAELKLEKDIHVTSLEIRRKNPKPVNPNFEFETTEEWQQQIVREWEYQTNKKVKAIDDEIKRREEAISSFSKELEEMKNE